jgi:hypothetical protein
MQQSRVILYHKQATSARTRFLRFAYNSVCAFEPLPKLAMLMDDEDASRVAVHPTVVIQEAEQQLGLPAGELEAEVEYTACVDVAGGPVNILLARFTSIDPPFELAEAMQATFVDLPAARDLGDVELQLLRKAYELILGG